MNESKVMELCSLIETIIGRGFAIAPRDKFFVFLSPLEDTNNAILLYLKTTDPARNKAVKSAIQSMLIQFGMLMGTLDPSDVEDINSIDSTVDAVLDPPPSSHPQRTQDLLNNVLKNKSLYGSFLFIMKLLRCSVEKLGEEIQIHSDFAQIVREITFPPEFYQAGVSILSYFHEILTQKYPDVNAGVSIKQEGSKVTMTITSPNGKTEIISKALQDYGMVITGKLDPHFLLDNEIHVLALKHKLELASMEIKHTQELMYTERHQYEKRIEQMEQEVRRFHSILANNLNREPSIVALIEVLKSAQTENITVIHKLIDILNKDLTEKDEAEFKQVMSELKDKEPALFGTVCDKIVFGTLTSTAGTYLFNWVNAICGLLK
jgi:hypothetical protein